MAGDQIKNVAVAQQVGGNQISTKQLFYTAPASTYFALRSLGGVVTWPYNDSSGTSVEDFSVVSLFYARSGALSTYYQFANILQRISGLSTGNLGVTASFTIVYSSLLIMNPGDQLSYTCPFTSTHISGTGTANAYRAQNTTDISLILSGVESS